MRFDFSQFFFNLHQSTAFLMHVNAAMLTMVNFVVSNNRIRSSTDLNSRESISINIVVFDKSATLAEDVNTPLMAIVNLIFSYGWIRVGRDPNACEVVAVDSILDELAEAVFVHINAAGLTVMYFALDNGWICSSFYLEPSDSIVVNVILLKISLENKFLKFCRTFRIHRTHHSIIERENSHVASMVNVIFAHYRRCKVLHPNSSQSIAANLIVLVGALRVVSDIKSNVLTIADITEFYIWIGTDAVYADSCPN